MRRLVLTIAIPVFATTAAAQDIPAGDQPGQIERRFQDQPAPRSKPRLLRGLESTVPPARAKSMKLVLSAVNVVGSTVFKSADFEPLYTEQIGQRVTLADVFQIAAKITAHYGKRGYALSRAIIPPQELDERGAQITIQLIEGYVDEVIWPDGLDDYRNYFDDYSSKIIADRPLRVQTMERYLLLANDLPGLTFQSNLRASKTNPGASTMVLTLKKKEFDASASVDNRGTESSGPLQSTLSASANNVLGKHERFTFGYTNAGPENGPSKSELHYFSGQLSKTLSSEGLTLDLSVNGSVGEPGNDTLVRLETETISLNASLGLKYPFLRTRPENLTGSVSLEFKNSETIQLDQSVSEDRLRFVHAELSWDKADEYKGTNQIIVSSSKGFVGLGSTDNDNAQASRSNGKVDFFKGTITASRTQSLSDRHQLYVGLFAQYAPHALLSSQECGYGGVSYGRGFAPSIITGDRCLMGFAEARYNVSLQTIGLSSWLDYLQVYSFADYGRIWNIDAPLGSAALDDAASGGFGFRFGKDWLTADIVATSTLLEPESTDDPQDRRVFFRLNARY